MRVAHFIHRYPPAVGGSEAYFGRLSEYLAAQGDTVTVFTTTANDLTAFYDPKARRLAPGEASLNGVLVRRFPLFHVPLVHRYFMKCLSLIPVPRWQALTVPFGPVVPSLWRWCGRAEEKFDYVHATAFPYSFTLACARRLARKLSVPFLLTPLLHTGAPDDPRDRIRRAYTTPALIDLARSADALFVQTEGEGEELVRHGIAPERIHLQGMGLDADSCTGGNRERATQRWDLASDEVVIGHLANNSPEKGTIDLLCAAQKLWQAGRRFTVLLAGPEMPAFQAFWKSFTPAGPVRQGGILDDEEKKDFFARIDVFAMPSRSDSFGLVFPESWANAIPCIAYRAGGVPWVICNGKDGLLAETGDLAGLSLLLDRLIGRPEDRRALGEAGLLRVRSGEFNWERKLSIVREVSERLCARWTGYPSRP